MFCLPTRATWRGGRPRPRPLVWLSFCLSVSFQQGERKHRLARGYGDILAAIQSVADGRGDDSPARLKFPEHFAAARVEGDQIALRVAGKHQPTGGRQQSSARRADHVKLPNSIAGFWIERQNASRAGSGPVHGARLIPLALHEFLLGEEKRHAVFRRAEVVEASLRAVSRGLPVVAAAHAGTGKVTLFCRILTGDQDRPAIGPDTVGPGNFGVRASVQ